jgi:hypothetical protein
MSKLIADLSSFCFSWGLLRKYGIQYEHECHVVCNCQYNYVSNIRFQVGRLVMFDIGGHTYLPLYIRFYIPLLVMKIIHVPRSLEKLEYSSTNKIIT